MAALLPALGVSVTWLCCLPLALGALGAGSAALGAALSPLRPWFTGLTVVLLGVAFYQAYRPHRADCGPGEGCSIEGSRPRRRVLLWLAALLAVALLTIGEWSSWVIFWVL